MQVNRNLGMGVCVCVCVCACVCVCMCVCVCEDKSTSSEQYYSTAGKNSSESVSTVQNISLPLNLANLAKTKCLLKVWVLKYVN